MDHYLEIRVMPDPEFNEEMLMAALMAKLHRVLGARGKGDIGICFPKMAVKPGDTLRVHGTRTALDEVEATCWRKGLSDYCQCSVISPVPQVKGWRTVSRYQPKGSPQRLLRRSVKKGWITEDEALKRLETSQEKRVSLPYLNMKSLSSKQNFRLFIRQGEMLPQPVYGVFTSYGLSATATIPWF